LNRLGKALIYYDLSTMAVAKTASVSAFCLPRLNFSVVVATSPQLMKRSRHIICFLHAKSEFGKDKNHEIDMKKCVTTCELADINKQRADETRETFLSS
jgi:hypothetical protein